jgi:hypothetical protein
MLQHKKFEYPAIAQLPKQVNNLLLQGYLENHMDRFEDNYTAHAGLCANNEMLADKTYNDTEHFHLTGPNFDADNIPKSSDGDKFNLRDKLRRNWNIHPYMDEYNWATPLPHYEGTDLHRHMTELFEAPIIRLRMSRMKPGGRVPPHIDYNTTYAVRFIIPISGNEGVVNKFWYKGEIVSHEMQAGKAYFLNIGYKHSVEHNGDKERYYLMGTLGGQQDIECLRR